MGLNRTKKILYLVLYLALLIFIIAACTLPIYVVKYRREIKDYPVHDVTVRVHYVDGGSDVFEFNRIDPSFPRMSAKYANPYLKTGTGVPVWGVVRFEVLQERRYTVKGKDLR